MSLRLSATRRLTSRARHLARARRRERPWVLEGLEARVLLSGNPTYYTVNLTSDTGASSGTDAATGDPSGDLLWAIEQANANSNPCGSVINFDPSVFDNVHTITLSSTLELSESPGPEVIDATGIAGTVIISGNNHVGVFQLDGGVTATLSGLTISDGSATNGGGILTQDYATLTLSNSTLSGNSATYGAALENNYLATVINSVFLNNTAGSQGGAIYNGDILSVTGSTVTGNSAGSAGGAVFNNNGAVATLSSDALSNNTAVLGGGIFNYGTVTLSGSTISDNTANTTNYNDGGGGIYNGGTLTITTSTISGNTAANTNAGGGGIFNAGGLTLTDSTLADNTAAGFEGGGGGLDNANVAVIEDSTLSGNSASSSSSGGGIYSRGPLTVVNSTIADNQASYQGGGIYNQAALTVVNSTVAYNVTSNGNGGGGIYTLANATLDNTIVAENDLNGNGDDLNWQGGGSFTGSNNLVVYDATATLSANNNLLGVTDPGIGLLANNGGPTQTIALLAGSPAIGAGSVALAVDPTTNQPLVYDQRGAGYPRIVNGTVDIGAFERPTTIGSPTVYTVTDASNSTSDTGSLPYAVAQADANVNLAGSIIQFDPSVFNAGNPQTITLAATLELSEPSGPITIDGPGADALTISGNNAVLVFQIDTGEVATLSGMTIADGSGDDGGGILNLDYAVLTLQNSTLANNSATYGGALYNSFQATVINSVFLNNTAGDWGGAIYNDDILSVSGSTFTGNSANGGDGGAIFNDDATATLSGDAFSNNTAYRGGALFNYQGGSSLSISGSTISGNTATSGDGGGGIFNDGGTLTTTTSTIAGNAATGGNGGGINNQGTLTLTDSTVADNSADNNAGGGLYNNGTAAIESSTFSGNSASNYGGGIWTDNTLTVVNSTLADNQSGTWGGGIVAFGGSLTVVDSTIAYNSSGVGGGIWTQIPGVTLDNTIVAENNLNSDGDDLVSQGNGSFTGSNNLVVYDRSGTLSSGDNLLGVADPGIGLLANNGGPSQTIALLAGSPAIDAGSNALAVDPTTNQPLVYDQRGAGYPRIVNGTVDIGAFERPTTIGSPTVYTVTDASNSTSDTGSLPYAVAQADANVNLAGSIIQFDPSVFNSSTPQTITLTGTLVLSEPSGPITITGPGALALTINGNDTGSVFQVVNNEVASISGLTITGGSGSDGGGIFNQWDLTLSNSTLTGNSATYGGALESDFEATVIDTVFLDNDAANQGGAIANYDTLNVSGSTFTGNSAGTGDGGAIFNDWVATLTDDAFSNNTAGSGGALFNQREMMSLSGCTVSGNTATAGNAGGGIFNYGTLTITTSTIAGNMATTNYNPYGGGIFNAGTLTLTDSTLADNSTALVNASGGGGLFNFYGGSAVIEDSTVSGNSGSEGGGIYNVATLTVVDSTIADNYSGYGGGVYNGADLTVVDSTIADNTGPAYGGGIWTSGPLTVVNSTIANNSSYDGGGIWRQAAEVTLDNTIVAENDDDLDGQGGGGFTGSNNLVGYDATGTLSNSDNLLGVSDPGLGILANNGGPTQTIALLTGSPAIAAGSVALAVDPTTDQPLAYDQRGAGFPRIVNGTVDIGAFERPASVGSPTVYTVTDTSNSATDTGSLPYAVAQADANINLAGCIIQFDPSVFNSSTPQTITLTGTLVLSEPSGPITINGPGANALTINGNNTGSVFQVVTNEVASISGLTITGGSASDGGGILDQWVLTLSNSTLTGNSATYGGALESDFEATVIDTVFLDNGAANQGGAIANYDTLNVSGSTFTGNSAGTGDGGAIFNYGGVATLSSDAFSDNTAGSGGGLLNSRGTLSLSGSTVSDNTATATAAGGGIYNDPSGTMTITTSTIAGNMATTTLNPYGGGIFNAGALTLTDSTLADNSTALVNASGGGGLFNFYGGSAVIEDSTVSGNSGSEGGGIYNVATLTVVDSTIAGNYSGYGGGVYNGADLTVVESTIADNTGTAYGGGIWTAAPLTAVNSTIANNTSNGGGGGIWAQAAEVTLDNTIVAENNYDLAGQGGGSFTGSNNLVGYDATGTLSNSDNLLNVADPGIGLLANNGGPTQTIALLAGSPAIDAGSNALAVNPITGQALTYDQRGAGFPRIVNGTVDIGAFERPTTIGSPTVYTVTDASNSIADTGSLPYAIAQANTNPNLAGSIIQFDPTVFNSSTPQTITLTGTLELAEPSGPITIDGPGADALTINADSTGSVFQVVTSEVASLSGLTITGGSAGGGILNEWELTLSNSTLTGNAGAGLENFFEATVSDCVFQNNTAGSGGGVYNDGTLSLSGCSFNGNSAGAGGAIENDRGGVATLTSDTFSNNTSANGGAIMNGGTMSLSGSTIAGNSVAGAAYGGGIYNIGTLTISTSTIGDNEAINGSGYGGGGIFNSNNGTLTLTASTLSGNYAYYYGGGLLNYGTAVLEDSTVAENSAYQGGGIYDSAPGLTVINSTIAYNSDSGYGPGIYNVGGSPTLDNTIVAWNTGCCGALTNRSWTLAERLLRAPAPTTSSGWTPPAASRMGSTATWSGSPMPGWARWDTMADPRRPLR